CAATTALARLARSPSRAASTRKTSSTAYVLIDRGRGPDECLPVPRPEHALVTARLRLDALVDELLDALTLVGLGRVEVALGVRRDRVHAVELAGLAAAVAERGELLERVAQDHAHPLVLAVGQEHELLVGILRERDVPHRAGGARVSGIERLLHERAVRLEHLEAVALPVADVDQPVARALDTVHRVAELG